MSGCFRPLLLCFVLGLGRASILAAPSAPATAAPPAPKPAPTPAAAAPATAAQPPLDPDIRALREEVERLWKAASEAEAGAADDAARLRARVELMTQLLLVVLHQQEQLHLQNQAVLAMLSGAGRTPSPAAPAAALSSPPRPRPAAPAGPLFGKRGGDKVHRPGCQSGERITPGTRITFPALAAAAAAGFQPCKICRPDRP